MPHFIHFSERRSCSVLHFLLGHTIVKVTPQLLQLLSRKVTALQLGQVTLNAIPQLLQRFQLSRIGLRQPGHRSGPTGFALPQNGQNCESGGFNCLQYLQGCLYPGISRSPNSSCENRGRLKFSAYKFSPAASASASDALQCTLLSRILPCTFRGGRGSVLRG